MAAEIAAGIIGHSLALLADAGHLFTDAAARAFALVASAMAARPAAGRWAFGSSRLEILAAQANGIPLGLIALWVVWSAVHRLVDPRDVRGGLVLAVALGGVAVSVAASFVLARASRESLNVRGAFLHVLTDVAAFGAAALAGGLILPARGDPFDPVPGPPVAASFVLARASRESLNVRGAFLHVLTDVAAFGAAALAGGLILATGWDRFDPIASLAVAALMLWSSLQLLRESTLIFLERAPGDADPEAIGRALVAEQDVVEVHDLHVWTVTSGFPARSAHVLVATGADCHAARRPLERTLTERFGLTHTTLQVEHAERATQTVELGEAVARHGPLGR